MPSCSNCGFDNVRMAKFCIECGTRVVSASLSQQERKKVTILFADVSGFTKLSEKLDPEELADITSEIYRIMGAAVYKYGGTVDKYLGDGVMVLFGAPKSHENDNERALLCALEIRRQLTKMWDTKNLDLLVSVGINAGVVISGKVGDDQRQDYTALGDVVNVAKRFEENARGGQILVSESIYRDLKNRFEWQPGEQIQVKGKSELLTVYELTRLASQKDLELLSGAGLAKLVGRDPEIHELEAFLDRVARGEAVELALLGDAGLGKSRMIYELRYYARKKDIGLLRGTGASHTQGQQFSIFDNMMRNYLGLNDWEDAEAALAHLDVLLETFDDDAERHERVGAIAWMMGYTHEASSVGLLSARQREALIQETMIHFLRSEAKKAPLLLIFDDLHWLDRASARLLQRVRAELQKTQAGVLLVGREEEMPLGEVPLPESIIRLRLFTRDEIEEYLKSVLVTPQLPEGLADMMYARTRGNPFFAEELIKALLVEKIVQRQGARYVLTRPLNDIAAPLGIQELLMSRIDLLDAESRRVMQCAAVIGETFPRRVLKTITEHYGIELDDCLDKLVETQLIIRKSLGDDEEFVFKHSLLRGVAYDSLLRKHQRDIHLKVAHAFETAYPNRIETFYRLLAEHYERAGMVPQAARYLLEEVESLLEQGEGSRAREALTQIRRLELDPELHADSYLDQVRLQLLLGIGLLEESLDGIESDDPRILLRMAQLRALVSMAIDPEPLHDLATLTGEVREMGVGTLLQAWTCLRAGDDDRAQEISVQAKNEFDEVGDRVGKAMSLEAMALSCLASRDHTMALSLMEESLQTLGSDAAAHLGWLRIQPLASLVGETTLLDLVIISSGLNESGFAGLPGHYLEDIEVVSRRGHDKLLDHIQSVIGPLLARQRDGLLRLLSFRGQVGLIVRPCVYWALALGRLPEPVRYLATPGTFLSQTGRLLKAEHYLGTDRDLCGDEVSVLLKETRQRDDADRADVLALGGSYLMGGYPSQQIEGRNMLQRAIRCLEQRPQSVFREHALSRLRGFETTPTSPGV